MIGEQEFAAMKSTAVMINVGRGPVIDEAALVSALSNDESKAPRWMFSIMSRCRKATRSMSWTMYLLSPHCADHTPDWLDNAMRFFIAQFERFPRRCAVAKCRG